MTTLAPFSAQLLIRAFGWSLLHFLWEGAIVAILLACVLGLLSGRSPRLRYMAACCALVLMVVLPLITFGRLVAVSHAMENAITSSTIVRSPALGSGDSLNGATESLLDQVAVRFDRSVPLVLAVWFTGVIFLLGRLNIGLIAARRMKSVATQPAAIELQQMLHTLSRRLGVMRPVKLATSALVQVPTVVGWLRPAILIPMGCLMGLSAIQVEAILAHELAHIRRHDYLVSVFQSVVEALLFYHPAVWWVSKQVRREREHCCDDLAVRVSGDSLAYAKALSFLEERRSSFPVVVLGANGGVLTMRIRRLLGHKETPAVSRLAVITLLAVVVAAAGLCIGTFARAQASTDKQAAVAVSGDAQTLSTPYQQWLDEDVRWIITPEERAGFMKLPTNDERDEFIKQFWLRRDPQPEDAKNTYRAEHYRRIAYANTHFAAGIPGWKTDRGRIYIVYGRPDSIDSHPNGGVDSAGKPFEVWHYGLIQEYGAPEQETLGYKTTVVTRKDVDMKFDDICSCGDYRLQSPPKQ